MQEILIITNPIKSGGSDGSKDHIRGVVANVELLVESGGLNDKEKE